MSIDPLGDRRLRPRPIRPAYKVRMLSSRAMSRSGPKTKSSHEAPDGARWRAWMLEQLALKSRAIPLPFPVEK